MFLGSWPGIIGIVRNGSPAAFPFFLFLAAALWLSGLVIVTAGQLKRRAELYHQLGSMITAGVPLMKAMEMVAENRAIRVSRKTILDLLSQLQAGFTFSESMANVHGWMPEFDIALLSAGEQSGRLDVSFKVLSEYYAARAKIIRDTIAGLVITAATLHMALLVFPLGYLISFAQGIMNSNFAQCVPFLLEKLAVFGVLYGAVLFLIFAGQGKRGEGWRAMIESLTGMIPILRTARKYLALSRLTAALEALIGAGVPIIKSWQLSAAASGSPRLRRNIEQWKPQLESGVTPGELISQTRYFPSMFVSLYNTAEQSGKIDETLHRLQTYYYEEGFSVLRVFTRIMNGTIYGVVAAVVAYNVIHFWMNYYAQIFQQSGF